MDAGALGLTAREHEILGLMAGGASNASIAAKLWVTEQTVKFHLSNVYRKLNVSNRTEAARWAQINGLLTEQRATPDGLAELHRPRRKRPPAVVGPPDHQEAAGGVQDNGADGYPDAVGLRGVGVVEVIGPGHGSTLSEGGALRAGPDGLQAFGVGLEEVACGEAA